MMKKTDLALAVAVVAAVGASLFNSASADYKLVCDGDPVATWDVIDRRVVINPDNGYGGACDIEDDGVC